MQPCIPRKIPTPAPCVWRCCSAACPANTRSAGFRQAPFVDNMDPDKYELIKIGITKDGPLAVHRGPLRPRWQTAAGKSCPATCPAPSAPTAPTTAPSCLPPAGHVEKLHIDVVIPVLHGLWGEGRNRPGPAGAGRQSPMWAAAFWPVPCAWTKQWPMPCSLPTTSPTAPGLPTPGHSWKPTPRHLQRPGSQAGLAHLCKAGQRRLQRRHQQGRQPGRAGRRHQVGPAERPAKVVFESFVDGQEVECAV